MATKEQSVTLLRKNKQAQVEALNSLGFGLSETARAADFPKYVKWGSGLLDVTVAANRKSDNRKFFFTVGEWQSLSVSEQSLFLLRGVRVRARGQSFIIAADTIQSKELGSVGSAAGETKTYTANSDLYSYFNAYNETLALKAVMEAVTGTSISGSPAADAALNYKAYTLASDGLEDDSKWCLPTMAHWFIIFLFIEQIEAVFTAVWSSDFNFLRADHWSCCRYSGDNLYFIGIQNAGQMYYTNPSTAKHVRPICLD